MCSQLRFLVGNERRRPQLLALDHEGFKRFAETGKWTSFEACGQLKIKMVKNPTITPQKKIHPVQSQKEKNEKRKTKPTVARNTTCKEKDLSFTQLHSAE